MTDPDAKAREIAADIEAVTRKSIAEGCSAEEIVEWIAGKLKTFALGQSSPTPEVARGAQEAGISFDDNDRAALFSVREGIRQLRNLFAELLAVDARANWNQWVKAIEAAITDLRSERDGARVDLVRCQEVLAIAAKECADLKTGGTEVARGETDVATLAEMVRFTVSRDSPRDRHVYLEAADALLTSQARVAAAEARLTPLTNALDKINAIRDSIIGLQTINWSEHIYPLVAALGDAGFEGKDYPEARENVGTLIERTNAAEAKIEARENLCRQVCDNYANKTAEAEAEVARLRAVVDAARRLMPFMDDFGASSETEWERRIITLRTALDAVAPAPPETEKE